MDAKPPSIPGEEKAAATSIPAASSSTDDASRPKPCCVCKDEKAKRDECMLFSRAQDPQADCQSYVDKYRSCMLGFGFKI